MKQVVFILTLILLCACTAKQPVTADNALINGKPRWYWTPSDGKALGGVGEAGYHVKGATAQRNLAISRAIESIALQKGVTISTVQEIKQQASSDGAGSTTVNSYSVHTVEGVVLCTQVREVWQDPVSGKIIVWVTELQ